MSRIELLGCPIDDYTMQETLTCIEQSIDKKQSLHHVVVNAAKLVHMQRDRDLRHSVVTSDIINADGQAVVWASRFLGKPLKERVAGIDLMYKLIELAHHKKYRIFFLGAQEYVVEKIVELVKTKYSPNLIAGSQHGYYNVNEEETVVQKIADSKADILFVAMGSPLKEVFLERYQAKMAIPFIMGVGGSFDVLAGKTKRAPLWMQKAGLEWFYRLAQEPRRMWKRYLITNTLFIWYVLKEKLGYVYK